MEVATQAPTKFSTGFSSFLFTKKTSLLQRQHHCFLKVIGVFDSLTQVLGRGFYNLLYSKNFEPNLQ
jgi:hypothetical protein